MANEQLTDLSHTRVLVVGLGKSGIGAARVALKKGAKSLTLFDERPASTFDPSTLDELIGLGATCAFGCQGSDKDQVFQSADLLVVSPGFPLKKPEIALAQSKGAKVVSEVEFASWFLPKTTKIIGISGTNGKSTVTALTGVLCEQTGKSVFAGGNLGNALSQAVLSDVAYDFAVVELSSFQLEGIDTFRPHVACLTNLTPDHIDRYESHQAYGLAKKRIFMNQTQGDFGIVNGRDCDVCHLIQGEKCRTFTFGFGTPETNSARMNCGEITVTIDEVSEKFSIKNNNLRGPHNIENAMAAILCARLSGVDHDCVQRGIDVYPGLHHRMESVGIIGGIEFINDSKATNVDSTIVALKSFDSGILLIAGGRGKGLPYDPLVELAPGRIRAVFTIGEDAPIIHRAFEGTVPVFDCGDLKSAMQRALQFGSEGDTVLLSPACASYDQFKNFEVRGEAFGQIFHELKSQSEGV